MDRDYERNYLKSIYNSYLKESYNKAFSKNNNKKASKNTNKKINKEYKKPVITSGILVPKKILEIEELNISDKLVLSILNHFTSDKFDKNTKNNKNNSIFITRPELLNLIPLSRNTIMSSLRLLIDLNIISMERIKNNDTSDFRYKITLNIAFKIHKNESYIFVPKEILYCKNLNVTDKLLLSYIKGFCKEDELFNLKDKTIIEFLCISQTYLTKSLSKLSKLGLLDIDTKHYKNKERGKYRVINFIDNVENINNMTIEEIKEVRNINNQNIEHANIENANNENIENAIIENADIKTIENVENINAKIINTKTIENANINILSDDLLNMLDKATLLKYKKIFDEKIIQIINNK